MILVGNQSTVNNVKDYFPKEFLINETNSKEKGNYSHNFDKLNKSNNCAFRELTIAEYLVLPPCPRPPPH